MLFVKVKDNVRENDRIKFEVLTRSPFNGKNFELNKDIFSELFRCDKNAMINTNLCDNKDDVYECIDKTFMKKLTWWETVICVITPLYVNIYESKTKASTSDFHSLNEYKEDYKKDFKEDTFVFSKDFKFFRTFFNTTVEIEREKYERAL